MTIDRAQFNVSLLADLLDSTVTLSGGPTLNASILGGDAEASGRVSGTASLDPLQLEKGSVSLGVVLGIPAYTTSVGALGYEVDVEVLVLASGGGELVFNKAQSGLEIIGSVNNLGAGLEATAETSVGPVGTQCLWTAKVAYGSELYPEIDDVSVTFNGSVSVNVDALLFERMVSFEVGRELISSDVAQGTRGAGSQAGQTDWEQKEKTGAPAFIRDTSRTVGG
ncbi:MAG: hypothetical protein J07HX64_01814 [halophilic archaeon J07HX64]|nr:MAG: hypothetical protein J07HX64_01814 [halophilic archaeon J07HX64]